LCFQSGYDKWKDHKGQKHQTPEYGLNKQAEYSSFKLLV
jgi:hypothetical protein